MRGIILALVLALAGADYAYLDPSFSQNKITVFDYEASVITGLPENYFVRAGINIACKLEIIPYSQRMYLLKAQSLTIKEINGARPKVPFTRSSKLTQVVAEQLSKPIKFEYHNGRIGNIYASNDVSETMVNFYKGILSLFQVNIKNPQNVYDLQETSIGGVCHTRYVIQEDKKGDQLVVVKSIDFNNCQEKVSKDIGMAFMEECITCKKMHRNIRDAATYTYKLKNREHNTVITQVTSEQIIRYSPFQERQGGAVMEAKQILTLAETKSSQQSTPQLQLQNRGNLHYQFGDEIYQIPFVLIKTKSLEAQTVEILQHIVQNNQQKLHRDVSIKFMQLVQLLRHATPDIIQTIWKQFAKKTRYRPWILQALPMAATADSLKVVYQILHSGDLTTAEALKLIPLAMLFSRASQRAMQIAEDIIKDSKIEKNPSLFKVAILGYGSMVKKYCNHLISTCPDSVLEPIQDLAAEALSKVHEEDMALALKALGNAGRPESLKSIQKFLPVFSSSASQLPVRIKVDAIMALRNIAKQEPHKVQEILMQVYMNREAQTEERMVAVLSLFETKPNFAMIANIANIAVRESKANLQIATFVYSQLKALANSSVPQLEPLAAACNVALKLFNPSIDSRGYRYSKVIRLDGLKYSLMSGAAAKLYVMNSASTMFPVFLMLKLKAYVGGAETDVIEVGIRGEGIEQILRKQDAQFRDFPMKKKIYQIVKMLKGFKSQPSQAPLLSGYFKVIGQEISFTQINEETLQTLTQALYEPVDRHAAIKSILNKLLNGLVGQYSKAIVAFEARHITPTTVGLPMELSWYSTAVANAPVNIEVKMTPAYTPDFSIAQLLESQLQINADVNPSLLIHGVSTMGINTHLIQSGIEFHGKVLTNIPGKFTARVDLKERNIKFEAQPCQQEDDLLRKSAHTYAISRNAEELDAVKKTPLVPNAVSQSILQKHFESTGRTSAEGASMMEASSETGPKKYIGLASSQRQYSSQTFKKCLKFPQVAVQVCLENQFLTAAARKNSILYHMVGDLDTKITIKPAHTDASIEKIQIEITAGPKAASKVIALIDVEEKEGEEMEESEIHRRLKTILGIDEQIAARNQSLAQKARKQKAKQSRKRTPAADGTET